MIERKGSDPHSTRSEAASELSVPRRLGAVAKTLRANPRTLARAGIYTLMDAIGGGGYGYALYEESSLSGPLPEDIITGLIVVGIVIFLKEYLYPKEALVRDKADKLTPGESLIYIKSGSIVQSWKTGQVQHPSRRSIVKE